ncbi:hypothetical protein HPB49_001112 [Dermacentor silvarum]|uniref:Uncharacterized protein n=1 Tax=Dermacentor silvarum TaxID=543639 RepID=A0ACB8D9Q4_DERSI|nr:hypothetical protein HPB49_001112 [Dermacentor silvarum]
MAGKGSRSRRGRANSDPFTILQWNCRGFKARTKRAALRLHLESYSHLPAVVALQEPGEHVALTNCTVYQRDAQTALCVHRNYTANSVDLDCDPLYSCVMVTLLPLRKQDPSIHILNIYSSPKQPNVTYADVFSKALTVAGREPLVIVGDFNAPSPHWGYRKEERRGRKLAELISTMGLTIQTDPAHPTRIGNSVTRDTCPDLTLTNHQSPRTSDMQRGSIPRKPSAVTTAFFSSQSERTPLPVPTTKRNFRTGPNSGYATWSQNLVTSLYQTEQTVQLSEATPAVDNHLRHLWEARHSLVRQWRRQKHNRQLKIRIAALTQEADEYAAQLADSNWVERCNTAAKQMSNRNTWRLFRALIDPSQTRTETQKHLQRAFHAYAGDADKLARALRDRYLCSQQDPLGLAEQHILTGHSLDDGACNVFARITRAILHGASKTRGQFLRRRVTGLGAKGGSANMCQCHQRGPNGSREDARQDLRQSARFYKEHSRSVNYCSAPDRTAGLQTGRSSNTPRAPHTCEAATRGRATRKASSVVGVKNASRVQSAHGCEWAHTPQCAQLKAAYKKGRRVNLAEAERDAPAAALLRICGGEAKRVPAVTDSVATESVGMPFRKERARTRLQTLAQFRLPSLDIRSVLRSRVAGASATSRAPGITTPGCAARTPVIHILRGVVVDWICNFQAGTPRARKLETRHRCGCPMQPFVFPNVLRGHKSVHLAVVYIAPYSHVTPSWPRQTALQF